MPQVGQEVRDVCRETGFDGFLPKPADRDAMTAEIQRLVCSKACKTTVTEASAHAAPLPLKAQAHGDFGGAGSSFVEALDFDTPTPNFSLRSSTCL